MTPKLDIYSGFNAIVSDTSLYVADVGKNHATPSTTSQADGEIGKYHIMVGYYGKVLKVSGNINHVDDRTCKYHIKGIYRLDIVGRVVK